MFWKGPQDDPDYLIKMNIIVGSGSVFLDPFFLNPLSLDPLSLVPLLLDPLSFDPLLLYPLSLGPLSLDCCRWVRCPLSKILYATSNFDGVIYWSLELPIE